MTPNRFRFRAWNKRKQSMDIGVEQTYLWEFMPLDTGENSDVVLMQSTGLLDKDGVEIFERDILRLTAFNSIFFPEVFEVVWCLERLGWIGQNGRERFDFSATGCPCLTAVIGNIYENVDLLEGRKRESKEL